MCHHSQPTCWPHAHSFFLGTGFLTTVSGHETLGGAQVRGPPPARTHVWDALKEQRLSRRHSPPMTLPSSEQVQKQRPRRNSSCQRSQVLPKARQGKCSCCSPQHTDFKPR